MQDSELFGPYTIGRRPGLGLQTGTEIETAPYTRTFGAALSVFLRSEGLPSACVSIDSLVRRTYPVLKMFSCTLPSLRGLDSEVFPDVVHAIPPQHDQPAMHSTVIYVENKEIAENIGVKGEYDQHVGSVGMLLTILMLARLPRWPCPADLLPPSRAAAPPSRRDRPLPAPRLPRVIHTFHSNS